MLTHCLFGISYKNKQVEYVCFQIFLTF
jgi:hypothetical protein